MAEELPLMTSQRASSTAQGNVSDLWLFFYGHVCLLFCFHVILTASQIKAAAREPLTA